MQDVKLNRNLYLGGSDIPIILGISNFKTRFDLLLEKAGLKEDLFEGNEYTQYGNEIEPLIREFCNKRYNTTFLEETFIKEDLRGHCDGVDDTYLLEIKSTSQIKKHLDDYEVYLVQLLFYMTLFDKKKGVLAVYKRPTNFEVVLNEKDLHIYEIDIEDYKEKLEEIFQAIDKFLLDLKIVKDNPFINELDLLPTDITKLADKVNKLEIKLEEMKVYENEIKKAKAQMFDSMELHGIKTFETPNGTKITKVASSKDKTEMIKEFNLDLFAEKNSVLFNEYNEEKEVLKKGRRGYVKITFPKGE